MNLRAPTCLPELFCSNIRIQTAAACCSCRSGRGEALLSFRRAPRGLALRRCRAGVTTQQRLRSPPPGMLGPRPSLLMIAAKTPSQCTMHASERTRDRAPLCVQGPSAPLHTPPPTCMPFGACKQLAQRVPDSAQAWRLDLPKAKPATRVAPPRALPVGRAPSLPPKGERGFFHKGERGSHPTE